MRSALIAFTLLLCLPATAQDELAVTRAIATAPGLWEPEEALVDGSRPDLMSATHAIEVDYAHKWAEAIGQALHYARLSGKRAGVILIIRKPADYRHVQKVRDNAEHYGLPLDVWTVREG